MAAPEAPRPWSDLEGSTSFEVGIDGYVYKLTEPSVLQLVAKGFVPAALVIGQAGGQASSSVAQSKFLIDEATQDAMLLTYVVEPALYKGPIADCPEGSVPLVRIGRHRDTLINAILSRLFDAELTRGAAFRGIEGDGVAVSPGRKGKRSNDRGAVSEAV